MNLQSPQIRQQTAFYGGANNTSTASQTGLLYVKANSKQKSHDLGVLGEGQLELMGNVGTHMGRNSVFLHFRLRDPMPIKLIRMVPVVVDDRQLGQSLKEVPRIEATYQNSPNKHHAKYISALLSDRYGKQLGLDDCGTCLESPASPGEYYVTITTQSYQTLPFHVLLRVGNPLVQQDLVEITRLKPA